MVSAVLVAVLSVLAPLATAYSTTDTITWGGDNTRAGYQTNHNMDPAVVGSEDFAQLFQTTLPGNYGGYKEVIFSQPLVYTPSNSTEQFVYFATTQNNVYKLDAKTGAILASRNLAIPFLTADLDGCVDINPTVGVTSTGVIDPDTDTLYLTLKTYADQTQINVAQGRPAGRYFIHALDVNDLSERDNFPVDLEGTVARNNPVRSFNGGIHHQRPALLHTGQYIYAGFASHCVQYNFTGWIIGWDKTSGQLVEHWATQGDGVPNTKPGAGIWMSGGGLASDDKGSMFFATGNGYASQLSTIPVEGRYPPTSLEEAAVHMTINDDGSLSIIDFFMPQEKQALDGADKDLGTSPLELLPSQFSCGDISRIGVVTGKSGKTYFLNMDDLGGYRTGTDSGDRVIQVYQNENSVYAGAGVYPLEGGYIYINVIKYPTHVFKFSCTAGTPSFTKIADSPENNAYILGVSHGTVTSLGDTPGTGLLWTCDVQNQNLRIYNAVPDGDKLTEIKSFSVPGTTKFTRAVFGDGRVYMGTTQGTVYGFGAPINNPLNCTTPAFSSQDLSVAAQNVTVKCTAVIGTSLTNITLNSSDFSVSDVPTGLPMTLAVGDSFQFTTSFKPSAIGLRTASVLVTTKNTVAGYTSQTPVRLSGTGTSQGPLLSISPNLIQFDNVVVGDNVNGVTLSALLSNDGNSSLTIKSIKFSQTSATGPFVEPSGGSNGSAIGPFTVSGLPSTIAANTVSTIDINFLPTTTGNSSLFIVVESDGGNGTLPVTGSAGSAPVWLMEFQTPDASGWVTYEENKNFTFGNVTENTSRTLKFRVTNNGTTDAVPLSITVSKPPFGVSGLVAAVNQVDLAEGTTLGAGQSATGSLYCSAPKVQWNTDPYFGSTNWTMNTNDPTTTKQHIQFSCEAVSEQAPPLQGNGLGTYRYSGCYKENNPGRQLSTQLYGDDNNTIAMCIAACAAGSYAYCGVQYQRECWAGPTIPTEQVSESDCNYACSGDINQVCGGNGVGTDAGGAFISLFALEGASNGTQPSTGPVVNPGSNGYASMGCYHEPSDSRALSNAVSTTNQTVDLCLEVAAASNYIYAGLEYGGECWVGNTLSANATNTSLSDCSMVCNNNATEYCGGPSLLNLYKLANATVTKPVVPGTVTNAGVDGYSFFGCYKEPDNGRALSSQLSVSNETVGACLEKASAAGYVYAGLEYGGECWCGNSLHTNATLQDTTVCSMACNDNSTEYCGGSLVLDVYKSNRTTSTTSTAVSSTQPTATPSGPAVNPGAEGYGYIGCYKEPSDSRALTNQLTVTNQTVDACLKVAAAAGYTYAGLEYGGECWCGNSIHVNATLDDSSTCAMTCNGNTTEYCGGSSHLDMYQFHVNSTASSSSAAATATTS